jgi:hypothetical protein
MPAQLSGALNPIGAILSNQALEKLERKVGTTGALGRVSNCGRTEIDAVKDSRAARR